MNRHSLANELAVSERLTLSTAVKAVEGVIRIVRETLAKGDEVYLRGLGTLAVIKREAKIGHDFRTGAPINVPAHLTAKLKVSPELKKLLNNGTNC